MAKENIKEFTQEVANNENQETEVKAVAEKLGLIERFKALKTWQKIAVIALLTGSTVGGIFLIRKLISTRPEAVAEAIDAVVENPDVVADAVAQTIE